VFHDNVVDSDAVFPTDLNEAFPGVLERSSVFSAGLNEVAIVRALSSLNEILRDRQLRLTVCRLLLPRRVTTRSQRGFKLRGALSFSWNDITSAGYRKASFGLECESSTRKSGGFRIPVSSDRCGVAVARRTTRRHLTTSNSSWFPRLSTSTDTGHHEKVRIYRPKDLARAFIQRARRRQCLLYKM